MILCVTPNPALDRTLVVPDFRLHDVSRATAVIAVAGGKGLNAARAIKQLGGEVTCASVLGGHTGRLFAQLAAQEGLQCEWTWINNETRLAIIIADGSGRDASLINEPGPRVTHDEWLQFAHSVTTLALKSHAVTFSGSVVNGLAPAQFAELLAACVEQGAQVWADSSGEWLQAAAGVPRINIKVNGEEAASLLGQPVNELRDAASAANALRKQFHLQRAILTLGRRGAACADEQGVWLAHPPAVKAVSSVGSGDCFLGALVLALSEGCVMSDALRSAVAAGAANAMSVGGGQFDLNDYRHALNETCVEKYDKAS
jgi:1-phosphofructokinase family hexose kinase